MITFFFSRPFSPTPAPTRRGVWLLRSFFCCVQFIYNSFIFIIIFLLVCMSYETGHVHFAYKLTIQTVNVGSVVWP